MSDEHNSGGSQRPGMPSGRDPCSPSRALEGAEPLGDGLGRAAGRGEGRPGLGEHASDTELMCYADGELDDTRLDEIARVLAHDAMAQAKLDAMSMVGDLLRELADGDARGDGIDAFVMQQIANEAAHVPVLEPVSPPGQAPLVPLPAVPQNHSAGASSHPSNDNWRGIFTLATVAAAVAAGFFLWSRTEPSGPTAVATSNIPMVSVPAGDPPQSDPAYSAAPDLKAAPFGVDAVAGIGVEVAAVDFGSLSGSVFYVPGDAAASDTTVLWVTDEGDAP